MYLVCILFIFACIVCICIYFLKQKLLGGMIYTDIYRYIHICTKYIQICTEYMADTYAIHADTYTFTLWIFQCISVFRVFYRACICMYVHILCILCMYLTGSSYLYVFVCICMIPYVSVYIP